MVSCVSDINSHFALTWHVFVALYEVCLLLKLLLRSLRQSELTVILSNGYDLDVFCMCEIHFSGLIVLV